MTTENTSKFVTVETVAKKALETSPSFSFDGVKSWHHAKADVPADVALWELLDKHTLSELMA